MIGFRSIVMLLVAFAGVAMVNADDDFDNQVTKEGCTTVLLNLVTPKGEITCDEMFVWSKCVARALGLDRKAPTSEDVQVFQEYLAKILYLVSLTCNVNLHTVLEAIRPGSPNPQTEYPPTESATQAPVYPTTESTKPPVIYPSYSTTNGPVNPGTRECLPFTENACSGRSNGNYAVCFPECQKGIFIACSNGLTKIMNCADGWYVTKNSPPQRQRFTDRLVYSRFWDMCLEATPDCPRDLDSQIEDKK